MGCWLGLRAFKTVLYRITLKIEFHFFTVSCKIPFKFFWNYYFSFFYQNKHWNIWWRDNHTTVVLSSQRIILKVVWFIYFLPHMAIVRTFWYLQVKGPLIQFPDRLPSVHSLPMVGQICSFVELFMFIIVWQDWKTQTPFFPEKPKGILLQWDKISVQSSSSLQATRNGSSDISEREIHSIQVMDF